MLWVGCFFLLFFVFDVWHRDRRHPTRRKVLMTIEGVVALGCFSYVIVKALL